MEDFGDDILVVAVGTLEVLHPRRHCKRLNAVPRIQKHDLELCLTTRVRRERLPVKMSTTAGSSKTKPGLLDARLHLVRVFYNLERECKKYK